MARSFSTIDTTLIHAGEPEPRYAGAVAMPVFQSATYTLEHPTDYHDIRYIRLNNTPNHLALHAKLAALEQAEAALVTASGMAAISTALLTVLVPGDHVLVQDCVYGGTHALFNQDLRAFGIEHDAIRGDAPASWEAKLRPRTRAIYVEAITNPLLQVADLRAVVDFARAHGLVSLVDNTFATPVNFRAVPFGFDLSLHSGTKYLNGHSDLVAGVVMGGTELIRRITHRLDHLGGSMDPHACFLLHRGLKTLALRVRQQNANAQRLAEHLQSHPAVARVHYPGLRSHPGHERARVLFDGFGGMVSFEPKGGTAAAQRLIDRVRIAIKAPSLGGVETLVSLPAFVSHAVLTREERAAIGLRDELVRVSVGIESSEDLIADFDQALAG